MHCLAPLCPAADGGLSRTSPPLVPGTTLGRQPLSVYSATSCAVTCLHRVCSDALITGAPCRELPVELSMSYQAMKKQGKMCDRSRDLKGT